MRTDASEKREKGKTVAPHEHLRKPVPKEVAEIGNSSTTTAQPHANMSANNLVNNKNSSEIRKT